MTDNQSIYRFMSFYELYELMVNKRLKFTKLRLMSDRNEGLGEIIRAQSTELGFMLRGEQEAIKSKHKEIKEQVYVSCWTSTRDAMSMWLLYSVDQSAIRVRTSFKKLQDCIDSNITFLNQRLSTPGGEMYARIGDCKAVQYVDFRVLHSEAKKRLIDYYKEVKKSLKAEGEINLDEASAYQKENWLNILDSGIFLKDMAYAHEHEVRGVFHIGVRNSMSIDEFHALPDNMAKMVGGPLLDFPNQQNSKDIFFAQTSDSFVDEICYDPRMPGYKRQVIEQIIGESQVPKSKSSVFGYLADEIDLTVPEDDYLF